MCYLKNVTYVVKKPELTEGSEGNENAEPETQKILGYVSYLLVMAYVLSVVVSE